MGDILICHIAAGDFNKYGFDLIYLITNKDNNKEVARGKTGIVCFDYDKRKIATAPAVLIDKLR